MLELIGWIHSVIGTNPEAAYAFFFLVSVAENILPIIPGDIAVIYGGYLIGRGVLGPVPMLGVTFLGHMAGFMFVYWLAKHYGRAILRLFPWLRNAEPWIDRAERHVLRFGIAFIVINRFLPGIRSVAPISVGLLRMRAHIVAYSALLSIAIWNSLLLYAGASLGRNWERVTHLLQSYNLIAGITIGIVAVVSGVIWYIARKRSLTKDV